jgi:hypothetical protein
MTATSYDLHGARIFACAAEGTKLRNGRDAVDLISEAVPHNADWILIPVERLDPDFFRLGTGVAGEFVQKFVTYRRRLVILGDISHNITASSALRDFVYESNRGEQVWFVTNIGELEKRLAPGRP